MVQQENETSTGTVIVVPNHVVEEIRMRLDFQDAMLNSLMRLLVEKERGEFFREWITLQEAQDFLRCKENYLMKARKAGLPFYSFGGKVLIRRSDLEEFAQTHKVIISRPGPDAEEDPEDRTGMLFNGGDGSNGEGQEL